MSSPINRADRVLGALIGCMSRARRDELIRELREMNAAEDRLELASNERCLQRLGVCERTAPNAEQLVWGRVALMSPDSRAALAAWIADCDAAELAVKGA